MELVIGGETVLLDACDYDSVSALKWHLSKRRGSIVAVKHSTSKRSKPLYLHRFILGVEHRMQFVDHINGNPLDNRRSNLRLCSRSENIRNQKIHSNNKCGFKGVHFNKKSKNWIGLIQFEKVKYHLGCFPSPQLAHEAYREKARELHGKFARFE